MAGYCGKHSFGGQLLSGAKEVELFNQTKEVRAEIAAISGLSAHGDADDLLQFLSSQDPQKVKAIFVVHGEFETQQNFKDRLETKGYEKIFIPKPSETFPLE